MSKKKSLPTRYHKGFFRARTEAKWAHCWDTWGMPYIYEHEDVVLAAMQKRYLPDFYASVLGGSSYIEIKGDKPSAMEMEKCEALCQEWGHPVLLINGSPWYNDYGITVFYPDYDVVQCHWCDRLMAWNEDHCPNCNNWTHFDYYEPSRTTEKATGVFGESPLTHSSLISVNTDKYLPLHRGYGVPLSFSRIWQGFSSLYLGFRLAHHAHFEYIQNWTPGLYQGACVAYPASFQTQDWSHAEWLYYAFCCELDINLMNTLVEFGITPMDFQRFYELYYSHTIYFGCEAVENILKCDIEKCLAMIKRGYEYLGVTNATRSAIEQVDRSIKHTADYILEFWELIISETLGYGCITRKLVILKLMIIALSQGLPSNLMIDLDTLNVWTSE